MIHLIHGPDIVASRGFLQKIRQEANSSLVLDSRKITGKVLLEKLEQTDLFNHQTIIIDWFDEKLLPLQIPKQNKIVVWSSQTIKNFSWADKVTNFPLKSVNIFKLADSFGLRQLALSQHNLKAVLQEKETPEAIIGILSRQLKLISFHLSGDSELVSKSSFVRQKIADQAGNWSEKGIKRAYRVLLESDLAIKNGLEPRTILSLALAKINP